MTNTQINSVLKTLAKKIGTSSFGYRQIEDKLKVAGVKTKKVDGVVQIESGEKIPPTVRTMIAELPTFTEWKKSVKESGDVPTAENIKHAMDVTEHFQIYTDFYYDIIKDDLAEVHTKYKSIPYSVMYAMLKKMREFEKKSDISLFNGVNDEFRKL